jgi:hypothetical protein
VPGASVVLDGKQLSGSVSVVKTSGNSTDTCLRIHAAQQSGNQMILTTKAVSA